MIVNTAYIYMGSGGGGGEPANPNLWQNGVSNYPVELTNSSIKVDGLKFIVGQGDATFSELPLTNFNRLTLTGLVSSGPTRTSEISIEFYSSDNVLIRTTPAEFPKSEKSVTVDIPSSAKIQNAKIKIKKTDYMSSLTFSSAVLS